MPTFDSLTCRKCGAIVENPTDSGKIVFVCTACPETRESGPADTLMASGNIEATGVDDYKFDKILRYISHFPYNPRPTDGKKCPKCKKSDNVRFVRLGPQEKKYYGCSCGKEGQDTVFT